MFGGQFVISLVFSLLLFSGILGEDALFAFVYPVLVSVYFVADVFITMISTDLIVRAFQNKTACMLSIVARDLVIIGVWVSILMYINISVVTLWGTISYAFPKILKIVIFDIINQQRYLHNYIKV
jgi:hypothetical protein